LHPARGAKGGKVVANEHKRILQIIPANGWYAAFNDLEAAEQFYSPLVCWALVTEGERQFITGMVAVKNKILACQEEVNFSHYVSHSELEMVDQNEE
jgi:hypothetical protein